MLETKKRKNILITRTKTQAEGMRVFLQKKGYHIMVEPLFIVDKTVLEKPTINQNENYSAIITSSNACDCLINSGLNKKNNIFAVGKTTANKLKEAGFENIMTAQENSANSLKELIEQRKKDDEKFLYFHGSKISLDFSKECANVKKILSYKTYEVKKFSKNLINFCQNNYFDYILFFSNSGVENFCKLVSDYNMWKFFADCQIACLSKKIGEKFLKLASLDDFSEKKLKIFNEITFLKEFYE